MSRNTLLILGGLVLAAAIGLVLLLKADSDAPAPRETTASTPGDSTPRTQGQGGVTPATPSPSVPPAPNLQTGDSEHPRDYAVGDIRVRDHRSGDHKPLDIPPQVHPEEGRKISSTITHSLAQQVRTAMMTCTASLPAEAKGDKPRLEGQIIISIKNQKATVTSSTMQLRNVTGDSVDATKACIEQKAIGLAADAPNEADLDGYSINLSHAIP